MRRQRNKQKYFILHYCGKVKAETASPGHKKSVKSVGHKKTPIDSTDLHRFIIFNPLHKRKIIFYQINATSATLTLNSLIINK